MILFATAFIIPILFLAGAFIITRKVCWKEGLLGIAIQLVVASVSTFICYKQNVEDVEVLNTYVVDKKKERVSCEHSYSCNCRSETTGSGKNKTTRTVCDTCYEHPYDYDWSVYTTLNKFRIHRIDRRGVKEPPRWSQVKIFEPVAILHEYDNYIKAAPGTLFRYQGQQKYEIPKYPDNVYDYYHLDRLVLVNGAKVEDAKLWNFSLEELNSYIGPKKQANIVVVIVNDYPREYFYALNQAWLGGKKNDVIVVVGTEGWIEIMAWAVDPLFQVRLRDALLNKQIDPNVMIPIIAEEVMASYVRKPMEDFAYLKSSITPTLTQWIVTLLVGTVVSVILTIIFVKIELFGNEQGKKFYKRKMRHEYWR